MNDEIIDNLMDAFIRYAEAKEEVDKCRGVCDYQAVYFCKQGLDAARESVKEALKALPIMLKEQV